jgi:superfamily II DNA/RNA helicase
MGNGMDTFNSLGIQDQYVNKLKERHITRPTEIQKLVIPRILSGENIIFRSETGTGKTFAYLLPLLQQLGENAELLICAPTFELCSQIKKEVEFATALPSALLIGSVTLEKQITNLKKIKPLIIVGNPGRLLALAKMKKLAFSGLRYLVMDEADRFTANECINETRELLSVIKRDINKKHGDVKPQCIACSATIGEKFRTLLGQDELSFENAVIIESDDNSILKNRILHWAVFCENRRKIQTLRSLLAAIAGKKPHFKALVFTSRNDEAGVILNKLQYHHYSAGGLSAKGDSSARKEALDNFRQGNINILVSTDLAARGLDIPNVTHIIALDVPEDKEIYIHRAGRTGRAGNKGIMISLGSETQMRCLAKLEKKLKIVVHPKELHNGMICGIE